MHRYSYYKTAACTPEVFIGDPQANKEVRIDVNIIVEYGSRIPDVAYEIQTRVKKSVENMTGLKVSEVNVHVQGVKTEKEVEEKEENEEVIEEQQ